MGVKQAIVIVALVSAGAYIAFGAREHFLADGGRDVAERGAAGDVRALAPVHALPPAAVDTASAAVEPVAEPSGSDAVRAPAESRPSEEAQDAAEMLRRAAGAYARVRSLRAEFTQELNNPLLGSRTSSRGTLFQRRPDRFLMRFSDPAGDVVVSDGTHFWIYYPSVDAQQVIRTPVSERGAGGADLQAQFLGNPLERFTPRLLGRESVAGRTAHVLVLTPREPLGYRSLKVWVDAQDYLVRRFEITEENGSVRHFELRALMINPALGDELFRFVAPADARIIDRGP